MIGAHPLYLRQDIRLNSLTEACAPNMYRWMCDPLVSQNLGLRKEASLELTINWIRGALQDPSIKPFAIYQLNQHVGNVIVDHIDHYLESARLSVYIGEASSRGSGVGLTSIYLAMEECFDTLKLHKIWLTVHSRNYAAINAYGRLGFSLEGILRDEFWLDGERLPAFYMGILHEDFDKLIVERESQDRGTK